VAVFVFDRDLRFELVTGAAVGDTDEVAALRRTIGALRPLVLDQCGLATAVDDLAHATCSRAALADCAITDRLGGERLDPDAETALFCVAQQALANVEQHAAARHGGSCWNGRGRR
jgi:two-component system, NarL family, sensor kinase